MGWINDWLRGKEQQNSVIPTMDEIEQLVNKHEIPDHVDNVRITEEQAYYDSLSKEE